MDATIGDMVIVAYRPKAGQEAALLALVQDHVKLLRRLGLATDRPALAMRGGDGIIIEVFEWRPGGAEAAHKHPKIHELWQQYAAACDYVKLQDLAEAGEMFATFEPINL